MQTNGIQRTAKGILERYPQMMGSHYPSEIIKRLASGELVKRGQIRIALNTAKFYQQQWTDIERTLATCFEDMK